MELIEKYKNINSFTKRITYSISTPIAELPYGHIWFTYDDSSEKKKQYEEFKAQLWNDITCEWI